MTEVRKPRRIAFILLWIATIALVALWDRSPLAIIVASVGVITLLFAFSARGWWPWIAALASAGFIASWALAFTDIDGTQSVVQVYLNVVGGALDQGSALDGAIVLSYELILPALHLLTFLFLIIGRMRAKRSS